MLVGGSSRIALQTAQALIKGSNSSNRVRVMFDSGSHKSFVTADVARAHNLKLLRKEWLSISTFGRKITESGLSGLLFDILVRFRENKVSLVGDIKKAFLNIEVDPGDRDCLRFLWVDDYKKESAETIVYRFCRVVFGLNASPFLLNATIIDII